MKYLMQSVIIIVLLMSLKPFAAAQTELILEVKKVQLFIHKGKSLGKGKKSPSKLSIVAKGDVPTAGWTNPELILFHYFVPPQDGIYDFDFVAKPPKGYVAQVITPIVAELTIGLSKDLKGARIHASSNFMEASLDKDASEIEEEDDDD